MYVKMSCVKTAILSIKFSGCYLNRIFKIFVLETDF